MRRGDSVLMNREEALALAARRKAARHRRTSRIRKAVVTVAVAAFIGPFAVIYGNVASGKDPAPANTVTAVASASGTTTPSGSTGSTSAGSSTTASSTSAPAAVTTQQS